MKQVLFSVLSAALLLSVVSCGDQKKRTLSEEGEKKQVSGIASHVINQTVENLREEEEDNTETPSKSLADAPTDVKELAAWIEVPFVDEDNVPLMGKDYVYEGLGDMFRFYVTGGKNDTAFGQVQWIIPQRTKGPIVYDLHPMGHSIYRLTDEGTDDTRGYIFVASDNRLLVPDGVRVKEYIIKD